LHGGSVKKRTFVITVLAGLATAGSVLLGARAIVGTTATLRNGDSTAHASESGQSDSGKEISALIADLSDPEYPEWAVGRERDPMVPYTPPAKPPPPRPSRPTRPNYEVKAVFLDQDPTAVILAGGETVIVRAGDVVQGNRVISIESDGVTIESEAGIHKYPFSPSN
jgi:hypothetical protein